MFKDDLPQGSTSVARDEEVSKKRNRSHHSKKEKHTFTYLVVIEDEASHGDYEFQEVIGPIYGMVLALECIDYLATSGAHRGDSKQERCYPLISGPRNSAQACDLA